VDDFFGYVDAHADTYVARLAEAVAIPSISAEPEHRGDVVRMCQWAAEWVQRLGGTAVLKDIGLQKVRATHCPSARCGVGVSPSRPTLTHTAPHGAPGVCCLARTNMCGLYVQWCLAYGGGGLWGWGLGEVSCLSSVAVQRPKPWNPGSSWLYLPRVASHLLPPTPCLPPPDAGHRGASPAPRGAGHHSCRRGPDQEDRVRVRAPGRAARQEGVCSVLYL
jgi:hypothetical protein